MDPFVFVELLDNHSDVGVAGLSALACTSKAFEAAVGVVWPARELAYRRRREEKAVPKRKVLPLPKDCTGAYPDLADACLYHMVTRQDGEPFVGFGWEEELSDWTRQTAMVPGDVAKREYFLATADLRLLQPFRDGGGPLYFRFEDVLGAAMLRHGRRRLADRMAARASKKDSKSRQRAERWRAVWAEVARVGIPEDYLTMSVVHAYAKDYVDTGRGGIRGIKKRLSDHRWFSYLVSTRVKPHHGPTYLLPLERTMVAHLQHAYVLTRLKDFVKDAIAVVRDMRSAAGM